MNGKLTLGVANSGDFNRIVNAYFTPPISIANLSSREAGSPLEIMIRSSSPGILDGDEYAYEIDLQENAQLVLTTQSFQRLYRMKSGATQTLTARVAKNASLVYLPHPMVPHEHSIFKSENIIHLEEDCNFISGEILTCGRAQNGELFKFEQYQSLSKIYLNNNLIFKENIFLSPSRFQMKGMGMLEGFTHQASLNCFGKTFHPGALNGFLEPLTNIQWGISKLPGGGFVLRLLGFSAYQLHTILQDTVTKILGIKQVARL